jgi:hypothetical protein
MQRVHGLREGAGFANGSAVATGRITLHGFFTAAMERCLTPTPRR